MGKLTISTSIFHSKLSVGVKIPGFITLKSLCVEDRIAQRPRPGVGGAPASFLERQLRVDSYRFFAKEMKVEVRKAMREIR